MRFQLEFLAPDGPSIITRLLFELREPVHSISKPFLMEVVVTGCRDSISIFKERIKEDGNYDETDTDHFENIQSTNYQTLRFKPPPPGGSIGEDRCKRYKTLRTINLFLQNLISVQYRSSLHSKTRTVVCKLGIYLVTQTRLQPYTNQKLKGV